MSTRRVTRNSTHWYGMLGYLLVGILGLAWALLQYNEVGDFAAGMWMMVVLLVLIFGGLMTYPLLFKDAMHLHRTNQRWRPSWWKYVGFGLGLPILVYFGGNSFAPNVENFAIALFVYTVTTILMNTSYLYRRHKYIGRP